MNLLKYLLNNFYRIGLSNEQAIKKQNEEKIIKLYKKNNEEIQIGDGNVRKKKLFILNFLFNLKIIIFF